ncbi:cytochrome P450 83B1-like [Arachis duranensis]|uniref:Cytochrome P450 83B1-like n=1 Tax=Arachis duranensis TaxID=130453 RepID=A0A6P4CGM2_ARADU|nr:cytochrome P450 83B1-like [Arachis duranensis]
MMPPLILLVLYLTLPLFLFFLVRNLMNPNKSKTLPPGPKGLPIIGNLYKLDNSVLHLQLWNLSKKFGPIFTLWLGFRPAIIISSPQLAEEAMKIQDPKVCGRPKFVAQQRISYNGIEMAFSPYDNCWKEIKKICVSNVLSPRRIAGYYSIRKEEVKKMMKKIQEHATSSEVVNLKDPLLNLMMNLVCKIVLGRTYEDEGPERERFLSLFDECNAWLGTYFLSDYFPFLSWIDRMMGLHSRLDKNFKELDEFYQEIIDEHSDPNRKVLEGEEDVTDILLQMQKDHSTSMDLTNDHVKAIIMDILVGATDTTAATTVWIMTNLIKNARVLKKVQEEIRSLGGKKDFLEEDEIQKFTYFKAVIKESLRLHLPAPIIPRAAHESCNIGGYQIPPNTLVYVNTWAIHRDPQSWKDPEEFYPERFLDNDINLRGQDFKLFPFGSGRRMCPGLPLATAALDLILANLLNSFDWELPEGIKREDIDYERLPGIAHHKKNPLYLIAKTHI